MSPEQASGKGVDKRADIWSFGVVLFEMLTGRPLFSGETPSEVMAAVIKEEPAWDRLPAGCPPAIMRLIHRCLRPFGVIGNSTRTANLAQCRALLPAGPAPAS